MTSSSLIGLLFVRRYPDMPCAADVVNTLDQQALASILTAYGEERHARKIASAIVEARRVSPITRTQQLASVVAGTSALPWLIPCSTLGGLQGKNKNLSGLFPGGTCASENRADMRHQSWLCFSLRRFHSKSLHERHKWQAGRDECGWNRKSLEPWKQKLTKVAGYPPLPHSAPPFGYKAHLTQTHAPTYADTNDALLHTAGLGLFYFIFFVFPDCCWVFFQFFFFLLQIWDARCRCHSYWAEQCVRQCHPGRTGVSKSSCLISFEEQADLTPVFFRNCSTIQDVSFWGSSVGGAVALSSVVTVMPTRKRYSGRTDEGMQV